MFWLASWDPTDPVWLTITTVLVLLIIYFLVRWLRSDKYSDRSDEYAKSCLEVVGFGCAVPLTVIVILGCVLVW